MHVRGDQFLAASLRPVLKVFSCLCSLEKIRQFTAEEEFRCRDSGLKLDINSKVVVERRPFLFCYGGFSAYCGSSRVQVSFHYQITLLDCM